MALDGLLNANPEFGDKTPPTSQFVDFNKYSNIPDTVPIDYSKLTQISDIDEYNIVSIQETRITDDGINKTSDYKTYNTNLASFKPMTNLIQTGAMGGIVIKSSFGFTNIQTLKLQILNENISGLPISQIKIKFDKNCIGICSPVSNIKLPQPISHKNMHSFIIPLQLIESQSITPKNNSNIQTIELIIDTNIIALKCKLLVPIHLFFHKHGQIKREQFSSFWKSIPKQTEIKRVISKIKSTDVLVIKSLLNNALIFNVAVKHIENKGDILYCSCRLHANISLIEISIGITGKTIIIAKSNNSYVQMLSVYAICSLLENNEKKTEKKIKKKYRNFHNNNNNNNSKYVESKQSNNNNTKYVASKQSNNNTLNGDYETKLQQAQIANDNLREMLKTERAKNSKLEYECKAIKQKYNELKYKYDEQQRKLLLGRQYIQWNVNDVINWMCSLDKGKYIKYKNKLLVTMNQENINGEQIAYVDTTDLHRFGIIDFADKKAIEKHIKRLPNNKT